MSYIIQEKNNTSKVENIKDFDRRADKIYLESTLEMSDPKHKAYLNKKNLKPSDIPGLRFGYYSNFPSLILPMKDSEGITRSIQFIYQDEDNNTQKRFLKDADKQGCFLRFDDLEECKQIFITEGIATGASLRKILEGLEMEETEKPGVVSAFSAQDIPKIGKLLKKKYPNAEIICAPDSDKAGDKAAKECKTLGIQSIFPARISEEKGTDWSDIYVRLSPEEAIEELEMAFNVMAFSQSKEMTTIEKLLDKIDEDPCKDFSMEDFPVVLKQYIESLCEMTEAHPIMIAMSVICTLSAMVGKKIYMQKGEYFQHLYPNIWSLCITNSGGFKTTALNNGAEIALEEDRKILQTMKDIESRDTQYDPLNDSSKLDAALRAEITRESLKRPMLPTRVTAEFLLKYLGQGHQGMIISSEIGEWLGNMEKKHNTDLKELFTYFYDVDIFPYEYRTKFSGGGIVDKPFITLNTVSTVDWVQEKVKANDVFSGFFARMLLFAPPFKRTVPPARPRKREVSPEGIEAKKKITDILKHVGSFEFFFSEESGRKFDVIHDALYAMARNPKYDERCQDFLEPYLKRWSPYVLKIVMLFRIIEDPFSREISLSSLKAGTAVVKVAMQSTAKLFQRELGESDNQRKQRKVFEWIAKRIKEKGKATLWNILRSRALEGGTKEYEEVLETLENSGKIECINPTIQNKKDREYVLNK